MSRYSRLITWGAFPRLMLITLLLVHEFTTMSKRQFNKFLPRTMMLRKLQKGQFKKLRNVKRFVNALYMDTVKIAGLASVRGGKIILKI